MVGQQEQMRPSPTPGKLFLGGISWETSEEGLRRHFAKFGNIVDCVIMLDPQTHRPRGFGFVTFDNAQSALEAAKVQFQMIDGRRVEVKTAVPKETMASKLRTKKIFVGGVPWTVNDDDLRNYFCKFGTVLDAQIIRDHDTGKSRGFGYVTFEDEGSVDKVIDMPHRVGDKNVDVKKAVPKSTPSERKRRNEANAVNGSAGGSPALPSLPHANGGGLEAGNGGGGGGGADHLLMQSPLSPVALHHPPAMCAPFSPPPSVFSHSSSSPSPSPSPSSLSSPLGSVPLAAGGGRAAVAAGSVGLAFSPPPQAAPGGSLPLHPMSLRGSLPLADMRNQRRDMPPEPGRSVVPPPMHHHAHAHAHAHAYAHAHPLAHAQFVLMDAQPLSPQQQHFSQFASPSPSPVSSPRSLPSCNPFSPPMSPSGVPLSPSRTPPPAQSPHHSPSRASFSPVGTPWQGSAGGGAGPAACACRRRNSNEDAFSGSPRSSGLFNPISPPSSVRPTPNVDVDAEGGAILAGLNALQVGERSMFQGPEGLGDAAGAGAGASGRGDDGAPAFGPFTLGGLLQGAASQREGVGENGSKGGGRDEEVGRHHQHQHHHQHPHQQEEEEDEDAESDRAAARVVEALNIDDDQPVANSSPFAARHALSSPLHGLVGLGGDDHRQRRQSTGSGSYGPSMSPLGPLSPQHPHMSPVPADSPNGHVPLRPCAPQQHPQHQHHQHQHPLQQQPQLFRREHAYPPPVHAHPTPPVMLGDDDAMQRQMAQQHQQNQHQHFLAQQHHHQQFLAQQHHHHHHQQQQAQMQMQMQMQMQLQAGLANGDQGMTYADALRRGAADHPGSFWGLPSN